MCVEVFKTNVDCPQASKQLLQELTLHFPLCHINFDLEDSDRILRLEGAAIAIPQVIAIMNRNGYFCETLV